MAIFEFTDPKLHENEYPHAMFPSVSVVTFRVPGIGSKNRLTGKGEPESKTKAIFEFTDPKSHENEYPLAMFSNFFVVTFAVPRIDSRDCLKSNEWSKSRKQDQI